CSPLCLVDRFLYVAEFDIGGRESDPWVGFLRLQLDRLFELLNGSLIKMQLEIGCAQIRMRLRPLLRGVRQVAQSLQRRQIIFGEKLRAAASKPVFAFSRPIE